MAGVIPVMQYGNIQPEWEVEGATFDETIALGLHQLKYIWDRVGEKPLDIDRGRKATPEGKIMCCWASGTQVYFDPIAHVYRGADGKRWLGGSTFAGQYQSEFAGATIAKRMADKAAKGGVTVNPDEILAMWELNADASATFGTAVHAALQLYGEYLELSRAVKDGSDESALTSNPVMRPIVEAFFKTRMHEKALYECFVADPARLHCGLIDRLVVEDDGSVWVEDFKTNADVQKEKKILPPFKGEVEDTALGAYWLQLSFYSRILQVHGKTVNGLRVHHWTGEPDGWVTYEHDVLDLDGIVAAAKAESK